MKLNIVIPICAAILSHRAAAQSLDTLLFTDQKVIGTIKKVTPETVSYTLPGKEIEYQLNKTKLIKICYGDGRVTESNLINKKVLTHVENWKDVALSTSDEDVHGLIKVGNIAMLGTADNDRGKACLKLEAALMGGNVVHVDGSSQFTSTSYFSSSSYNRRSRYGSSYSYPYTRLYTQTKATIYTSKPLDTVAFKKITQQGFTLSWAGLFKHKGRNKHRIAYQESDPSETKIVKYVIEDNNLFVWLDLHGFKTTKLHVNYFDKDRILLSYKNSWNQRSEVLLFLIKPATLHVSKST